MGQSYRCSVCDNELDSPANVGELHQFCEECLENKQEEISRYNQNDHIEKGSTLRKIKENIRRS